jgi:hypothetical protein
MTQPRSLIRGAIRAKAHHHSWLVEKSNMNIRMIHKRELRFQKSIVHPLGEAARQGFQPLLRRQLSALVCRKGA